jgi:hypothetical protein
MGHEDLKNRKQAYLYFAGSQIHGQHGAGPRIPQQPLRRIPCNALIDTIKRNRSVFRASVQIPSACGGIDA